MAGAEDDRIDALYGLPLDRFVAERGALVKILRSEGERTAATAVGKLPKPTRAAWAVNTAVREHPRQARTLREAARVLADVQREVLAGGDRSALRKAGESARAAVEAMMAVLPDAGEAARDKARSTLQAGLVDEDVLAEVMAARLVRERAASGFGGLDAPLPKRRGRASPDSATRRSGQRQARLRRAKEEEAAIAGEVTAARRALDQVEAVLAERRAQLKDAEARLADARRRRERVER